MKSKRMTALVAASCFLLGMASEGCGAKATRKPRLRKLHATPAKKDYAIDFCEELVRKYGVSVDMDIVASMIESELAEAKEIFRKELRGQSLEVKEIRNLWNQPLPQT